MGIFIRSTSTALLILASIQCFTVGVLSPRLSLEICQPGVQTTQRLDFEKVKSFHIKNADGAIKINSADTDTIQVTADVRAFTPDSDTQSVAEQYLSTLFATEVRDNSVQIVTEPEARPDDVDMVVNYIVVVPRGTDLRLEGSNGNVSVGPGCGKIFINSNNTDVLVEEPGGRVHATIANGRIRVEKAADETTLETVNGSIYANMTGGSLSATTANGNINAKMLDPTVASCELTAMNGGITLALSEACSAEVNAETRRGVVRSEIPVAEKLVEEKRRTLRGRIGSTGSTRLDLNSLNGNIVITRSAV